MTDADDDAAVRHREVAAGIRRHQELDAAPVIGFLAGGAVGIAITVVFLVAGHDIGFVFGAVFGTPFLGIELARLVVERRYRAVLGIPPQPVLAPARSAPPKELTQPEETYVDRRVDLQASSSSSSPVAVPSLPPWKS